MAVEDFAADGGEAREVGREGVVEQGAEGGECEAEGGQKGQEGRATILPLPLREGVGGRGLCGPGVAPSPNPLPQGEG